MCIEDIDVDAVPEVEISDSESVVAPAPVSEVTVPEVVTEAPDVLYQVSMREVHPLQTLQSSAHRHGALYPHKTSPNLPAGYRKESVNRVCSLVSDRM